MKAPNKNHDSQNDAGARMTWTRQLPSLVRRIGAMLLSFASLVGLQVMQGCGDELALTSTGPEMDVPKVSVTMTTGTSLMTLTDAGVVDGIRSFKGQRIDYLSETTSAITYQAVSDQGAIQNVEQLDDGGTLYLVKGSTTGVQNKVYVWETGTSLTCIVVRGDSGESANFVWTNVNQLSTSDTSALARMSKNGTLVSIALWSNESFDTVDEAVDACETQCASETSGMDEEWQSVSCQAYQSADPGVLHYSCTCTCYGYDK